MRGLDPQLEVLTKIRASIGQLQGNWIVCARPLISPGTDVRDIDACFADLAKLLQHNSQKYRNQTLIELKEIANRTRPRSFWGDTLKKLASAVCAINAARAACNQFAHRFCQCKSFLPEDVWLTSTESIERCRQDCAAGRTQERRLQLAFRGLKHILDALIPDEVEQILRTSGHVDLFQEKLDILRRRINQIHRTSENTMNSEIVTMMEAISKQKTAPYEPATLPRRDASLTESQRELEAHLLNQDECLVSIIHLIELASRQPDTLPTGQGDHIAIADLLQAVRDFDLLHLELAAVTQMAHDIHKTASTLAELMQDHLMNRRDAMTLLVS